MATEFQFKITGGTYHFEKQSVCCHSKGPNLNVGAFMKSGVTTWSFGTIEAVT